MKKLNIKGFAHWIVPALVLSVVAGIGTYLMVGSHANLPTPDGGSVTKAQCTSAGGAWKDLRGKGIDHSPCWGAPGAYLINYGNGKTGAGIYYVPNSGRTAQSPKTNYPDYIIIVSGKWQLCGLSESTPKITTCTWRSEPFTHSNSAAYRTNPGGETKNLPGAAHSLSDHQFYWANSRGNYYTRFSTDTGIYLNRL